jgi:hypothetical protein
MPPRTAASTLARTIMVVSKTPTGAASAGSTTREKFRGEGRPEREQGEEVGARALHLLPRNLRLPVGEQDAGEIPLFVEHVLPDQTVGLHSDCAYAELWITARTSSSSGPITPATTWVACTRSSVRARRTAWTPSNYGHHVRDVLCDVHSRFDHGGVHVHDEERPRALGRDERASTVEKHDPVRTLAGPDVDRPLYPRFRHVDDGQGSARSVARTVVRHDRGGAVRGDRPPRADRFLWGASRAAGPMRRR